MRNIGKTLKGFLMVEQSMPDEVNLSLRAQGIITESEVVLRVGDILIAYNVISQKRRKLNVSETSIIEDNRTLLKG